MKKKLATVLLLVFVAALVSVDSILIWAVLANTEADVVGKTRHSVAHSPSIETTLFVTRVRDSVYRTHHPNPKVPTLLLYTRPCDAPADKTEVTFTRVLGGYTGGIRFPTGEACDVYTWVWPNSQPRNA